MNTDTLYNKIEAYLRKELDESAMTSFRQEIESNPELASEVEKHRKAEMVLQYGFQQRMKSRLNKIDQELENTEPVSNKPAKRISMVRKWSIAASVLLMLGIGSHFWVNSQFDSTAIAEKNYIHVENQNNRGGDNGFEGSPYIALLQAEEAVELGKFQTAIGILKDIAEGTTTLDETAEINLAMTYLLDGQKANAEEILSKITTNRNHEFYPNANRLLKKMNGAAYKYAN